MYATTHPRTHSQAVGIPASASHLHTALLTAAAFIVGGFMIATVLALSVLLAGPLPATDGAAPVPQVLPQPSAGAGLGL